MKKETLEPVIVIGEAQNANEGAIIETDSQTYFLEGINRWPPAIVGRKVEAKGLLIKETYSAADLKDKNGRWIQGSIGDKYIIADPEWKTMS